MSHLDSLSELRVALRSRNTTLFQETEAIIQHVTPLLWHTIATFPSGTSHTPEHTATVEKIASIIVTPQLVTQLTDDEIQLLILACHIHDLGMAGTESDNRDHASREQARRDHAIRIGDRIKAEWQVLGLRDETLAELLSEVCRGHRPAKIDGEADWSDIRPQAIVAPSRFVRLRLLSALVYAADELHIGADRAARREQDWLQVEDEEALRHWNRHQCITGPVIILGVILYEIRVATLIAEDDIRKHVLRKACSAVRDANRQLAADAINGGLPQIDVQWIRDNLWKQLLLTVQCDQVPRRNIELVELIQQRFTEGSAGFDNLNDLCGEPSASAEWSATTIKRVVNDFVCRGHLVASSFPETVILCTRPSSASEFFAITRSADELDVLLAGRYAAHHEFDLLRSAYGTAFADECLTPIIERGFGVNLATEHTESPVQSLVRASPTVARLLMEFAPAPSILVQRQLLRLLVLAGMSFDLMRAPGLMLNKKVRNAIKQVSQAVAENQPNFLTFIEELILVGGYSFEQVCESMVRSEPAAKEDAESVESDGSDHVSPNCSLKLTQQFLPELSPLAVSFAHLFLAGARSSQTIELRNTKEAPFQVKVDSTSMPSISDTNPLKIAVGPGKPSLPARVNLRASIVMYDDASCIELRVHGLDENLSRDLPITIGLPVPALVKGGNVNTDFGFFWPAIGAQQLRSLRKACGAALNGAVEIRLILDKENRLLGSNCFPTEVFEESLPTIPNDVVEFLCSVSSQTPLPLWIPDQELERFIQGDENERMHIYKSYAVGTGVEKKEVTSVTLRYANMSGHDYREEYLGFFPGIHFGPPTIGEGGPKTQQEINDLWENSKVEARLSSSFQEDCYYLADEIRKWAADPSEPFPLDIGSGAPETPVFKTRFELVVCPKVDRHWYFERPIILRVRPIQRVEHWEVEGSYWESQGDVDRAEILKERLQLAQAQESQAKHEP